MKNLSVVICGFCLATLLAVTFFLYQPGLFGGYLLDDVNTLSKIALINGDFSLENLWKYFAASDTGPLKRPISVFSFLMDANEWPASAYNFKLTNLLIHLLNGGVLFVLLYKLFALHQIYKSQAVWIATISAGLWLLSPFLLSTTLYVVQRMSMLPGSFTLMGFLVYLLLRVRVNHTKSNLNYFWLFLCSGSFLILSVLSKENGILFIFQLCLFEVMILQRWLGIDSLSKRMMRWLHYIPVLLLALLILLLFISRLEGYDVRTFSVLERFLSQFRALSQYLFYLFIPHYFTEGVFTDGFVKSTSLIHPITTLTSVLFVVTVLIFAWTLRRKYIWVSFGIFFFFVGHILESSFIPLELYFEHRNYVPSIFIYVPLALLFVNLIKKTKLFVLVVLLVMSLFGMSLHMRANLWSNEHFLFQQTIDKYPDSIRARLSYASSFEISGMPIEALKIVENGLSHIEKLELRQAYVYIKCNIHDLSDEEFDIYLTTLENQQFTKEDIMLFELFSEKIIHDQCNNANLKHKYLSAVNALEHNLIPRTQYGIPLVKYFKAKYYLFVENEVEMAANLYTEAFQANHDYVTAVMSIKDLITHKAFADAYELNQKALTIYDKEFEFKPDWKEYGKVLRAYEKILIQKQGTDQ